MPYNKLLSLLLVATLLWLQVPLPAHAQTPASDYTFGDCSTADQEQLRAEIEQVAHAVLTDESTGIDINAIVMRQWINLQVDTAIDREVQLAIDNVYATEGYWTRLWSGWSAEKAEEFATRVANEAFTSEGFHTTINALSLAIAQEISVEIEANFARAASAAFLCMKAYVGDKYSNTLFSAFEGKVSTEVSAVDLQTETEVDVTALDVHGKALGGVSLIIVTELSRRIAIKLSEKIAERIAGKIVGRIIGKAGSSLIPVAGWVIGLGLIAWDLWEGGNGALPQIQEALEGEEVKAKIRQEVADAIKDGLPEEVSIVSLEIAVSLVEDWNSFCNTNRTVCTLAEDNRTFRDILEYTSLDQVSQLVSLVNLFMDNLGRAELERAIDMGQFEALLLLPTETLPLLARTKSVATTLAWADLAGERLSKVAELEIDTQKSPADFDAESLRTLLNLDDAATVSKVLPLTREQFSQLVTFADNHFVRLVNRLSAAEIGQLVDYLATTNNAIPATLASDLASGQQRVAGLVNAPTTSTATPPAAIAAPTAVPLLSMIWQFIYSNSIVVAAGLILIAVLLIGVISALARSRAAQRPVDATPKPKKQRPKKRGVYDIFDE